MNTPDVIHRTAGRVATVGLLFCMACTGRRLLEAPSATCIGTSDDTSRRVHNFVRRVASARDESSEGLRSALGFSIMESASVAPVTDARICQRALAGVNAAFQSPRTSRAMYVFVVGRNYAAFDPREQVAHGGGAVVFLDSTFEPLRVVLAPSVY